MSLWSFKKILEKIVQEKSSKALDEPVPKRFFLEKITT